MTRVAKYLAWCARRAAWMSALPLLLVAGCGDTGQDVNPAVIGDGAFPTTPGPIDGGGDVGMEPPEPEPKTEPVLRVGESITLSNNKETVQVTLHDLSYPEPKGFDEPSRGKVFVLLEMTIKNVGKKAVYGANVYPAWEGKDGRLISDTGWVISPFGRYTTGQFREELSDSVPAGLYIRGFSMYEIPKEPGTLVFPYGPSTWMVDVDPT